MEKKTTNSLVALLRTVRTDIHKFLPLRIAASKIPCASCASHCPKYQTLEILIYDQLEKDRRHEQEEVTLIYNHDLRCKFLY